ncbi:hypothetical protein [Companilactobacillus mishanensis]|uniref:Uncharacterized protein n=1 Tax=Companilactobacillus mishanensis TaxID=2486008 RepID=A0ABW9P5T3_9LACO|nr:hypothetical protein [Companilactobacillus mishanensis]MQS44432.1 hypothetical protein [Companilactobacillus mishanensis]MQS88675.1 hypothetical protein [Companilactobacillus mishanensis]
MQLQTRLNNNFAKNLIHSTTDFIDRNFDIRFGENDMSQLIQMPMNQLSLFAHQSLENRYLVVITMLNEEQYHGKLIKAVDQNKYIMKITDGFYKIVELDQLKSINLI